MTCSQWATPMEATHIYKPTPRRGTLLTRDATQPKLTKIATMTIEFSGTIFYWRGPAPFYFVKTPPEQSRELKDVMKLAPTAGA